MKKYSVKLLNCARRDLDGIYAYIAKKLLEPGTAISLIEQIEEQILSLDTMPYRCPERRSGVYANQGYRELLVGNYTAVYRIGETKQQVIIVTVRYSPSNF